MKPVVNDTCIGCGTCEGICEDVFKIEDKDGKMIAVVQEADYEKNKEKIDEAISACPVQSISWE
jgi:ferredoxin